MQRQPENDRDRARGRKQTLDRQIEDIGDDREQGGEVDEAGEQVLNELALARAVLGDDEGAQKADQEPGRPQPPGDLQRGTDGIFERHAGRNERLIGHHPGPQQDDGQDGESDHPDDRLGERMPAEQEVDQKRAQAEDH